MPLTPHLDLTISIGNIITIVTVAISLAYTFGMLITVVKHQEEDINEIRINVVNTNERIDRQDADNTRRFEASTAQIQHLLEVLVQQQKRRS